MNCFIAMPSSSKMQEERLMPVTMHCTVATACHLSRLQHLVLNTNGCGVNMTCEVVMQGTCMHQQQQIQAAQHVAANNQYL